MNYYLYCCLAYPFVFVLCFVYAMIVFDKGASDSLGGDAQQLRALGNAQF